MTTVADGVSKVAEEGRQLGLVLNPTKCEIIGLSQSAVNRIEAFYYFNVVQLEDLTLLGSLVQPGPAVDAALETKCADLSRAVSRLYLLHAHDALVILRNSLSVPTLYTANRKLFRTTSPAEI